MRNRVIGSVALMSLMLASCSGNDVSKALGMQKQAPDEFRVLARPPLTMPPEYNLRPPGEGESKRVEPAQKASVLLLGKDQMAVKPSASDAAQSLLQQAGASDAEADIRDTLDAEYDAAPAKPKGFWDKFKSGTLIKDGSEPKKGEVLDAEEEFERLRKERAN